MKLSAGERKRHQILDAALKVIAADGVDAVTHRSVGKQAGVSHGVVSYHFPTRDSLIYRSFEHYFGSFADLQAKAGWSSKEKMSKRRIVDVLTKVVAVELADASATLVEQELLLVAARRPELAALYREWEEKGISVFSEGLKRSGYKTPRRIALVLVNFIRGFLLESLTDPALTELDFKERAKIFVANLSSETTKN